MTANVAHTTSPRAASQLSSIHRGSLAPRLTDVETDTEKATPRLLIVGCSTRAAGWSAVRAGLIPIAADQFADQDLWQVAEVVDLPDYPTGLPAAVAGIPSSAWMFVGALENAPELLEEISIQATAVGPLLSGKPRILHQLRDPLRLQDCAVRAGLPRTRVIMSNLPKIEFDSPESTLEPGEHDSGTAVGFQGWLKKPLRSGGGLGILHVPNLPGVRESASGLQSDVYYQEYIEGKSVSLIGVSHASGCAAIGWTEQLVGAPASRHSESFGYCGSIGPLTISSETTSRVIRAIDHLVQDLGFRGLFGVDAILSRDGVHLVEFNPRYTASCEILELTLRRAILQDHWLACQEMNSPGTLPEPLELPGRCDLLAGKMIVYASQAVAAPDFRRFLRPRSPWSFPFLADIPHIGTQFPQGSPLCTVFATGKTPEQVRERLVRRASRVRRWFGESPQDELPECSI